MVVIVTFSFCFFKNIDIAMLRRLVMFLMGLAVSVLCQLPYDYYHGLHLPHDPPPFPTWDRTPYTSFTCVGRQRGYFADVDAGCQAYHFCWHQRLVSSNLCANGTLFNEQFQVCDHFYNVRCGSPFEDL